MATVEPPSSSSATRRAALALLAEKYGPSFKDEAALLLIDASARQDLPVLDALLTALNPKMYVRTSGMIYVLYATIYHNNLNLLPRFIEFEPKFLPPCFLMAASTGIESLSYFYNHYKPSDFDLTLLERIQPIIGNRSQADIDQFQQWLGEIKLETKFKRIDIFTRSWILYCLKLFRFSHARTQLIHVLTAITVLGPVVYLDCREILNYENFRVLSEWSRADFKSKCEKPMLSRWLTRFAPDFLPLFSAQYGPVRITVDLPNGDTADFYYRRNNDGSASKTLESIWINTDGVAKVFTPYVPYDYYAD